MITLTPNNTYDTQASFHVQCPDCHSDMVFDPNQLPDVISSTTLVGAFLCPKCMSVAGFQFDLHDSTSMDRKYQAFQNNWETLYETICQDKKYPNWEDEQACYFTALSEEFNVPDAVDIWYAPQRSWYKPEMMNVIVDMLRNPEKYDFHPNFTSHDFEWTDNQFREKQ